MGSSKKIWEHSVMRTNIALLVLLATSISCVKNNLELTTPQANIGRDVAGEVAAPVFSEGKRLWIQNCASCHTNPQSQLPTKFFATANEISRAIEVELAMRFLGSLENTQIEAIAEYLADESIQEAQARKSNVEATKKIILGNRSYVVSKLFSIYLSSTGTTANDTTLRAIINYIGENPSAFGGSCVSNHEICAGTGNITALMSGDPNVIRSGIRTKVCRELHNNSAAVNNVLGRLSIAVGDEFNDAALEKILALYVPSMSVADMPAALRGELASIFNAALASGSRLDAWSLVTYSLCDSVLFEKI